ncbi:MAG: outer membrane protein transport protein [Myxococcota bacterium]
MIAWLCAPAWAAGFEVAQQGAIAGGTAHAGTARVSAESAWFDPAALADDGGLRVAVGAAAAAVRIDAEGDGWAARSQTPLGTPPHLYASWSGHHLLAGVAVNTAFAGGVAWAPDGPLRFEIIESAPRFLRVAPFLGAGLGPVRLAAGLHVDAGSLHVLKATDHVTEEGTAELSLRGAGVGADASLYLQATDALAVGLSYKGRTRLPLAGEADFDVPPAFAPQLPDQGIAASWRLPDRVALGVRTELGPGRLVADLVYTAWSVNDVLAIDLQDPASDDVTQANAWRDSLAARLGGEVDVAVATLRAGAAVDGLGGAAVPVETLGPSSPDGPRVEVTVGAGVAPVPALRVDAFGEVLAVLQRTSTSADAPEASYRGRALVAGLTVTLAAPPRPPRGPRPL